MQVEVIGIPLLGTLMGKRGDVCMIWRKRDFFVSRDVVFSEGVFPFASNFLFYNDGLPDDEVVHEDLEESSTPILRVVKEFV